jgi:N utilization substance protein B
VDKQAITGKRRARKFAIQALYQWSMTGQELSLIEAQFRSIHDMARVDTDYFCRILYGVSEHLNTLEAKISPFLDRPIKELNPIELAVLRLGAFELVYCLEIPYRVVLDESVSLTKVFGSQDGHKYVNGVLNQLARMERQPEIGLENE